MTQHTALRHAVIDSPVGQLTAVEYQLGLAAIYWQEHKRRPSIETLGALADAADSPVMEETAQQLGQYFAGERREFELPLAPSGNEFQHRVWALLKEIPYGELRSYGQLAVELGDKSLAQAVGAANGRNPLSIVVPCHRVVAANGALTGFAGGLERKEFLLALENPKRGLSETLF